MKRRQQGATLIETLIAIVIIALFMMSVFNVVVGTGRASASYELTSSLSRYSRTAIDEVLFQTRGGDSLLSTAVLNGKRIYTSATTAIVRLPAFHPNSSDPFLNNAWDIVAFEYDPNTRTLYETIQPANGSTRPARTRYPIARNVRSLEFTYRARQNYKAITLGVQAFALGAPLASTVNSALGLTSSSAQVFVDGVPTAFESLLGNSVITAKAPLGGAVQIIYPVAPWLDGGASLPFVDSIRVSLTLEDPTTTKGSVSLQADSTLRNHTTPVPTLSSIVSSL